MISPGAVLRDRIVFVLVHPQHPGNLGSAARALKNMGLRRLAVVPPATFDLERARWMAAGARDVLEATRFFGSVEEAIADCSWAVGCTARGRRWDWPVLDPAAFAHQAFGGDSADVPPPVTALLFGREDKGLSNAALACCQSLLHIPTDGAPSINLAQAVLLIGEALLREARLRGHESEGVAAKGKHGGELSPTPTWTAPVSAASLDDQREVVEEALSFLGRTAYMRSRTPPQVQVLLSTLLHRASPTPKELNVLRGMIKKSRWSLLNGAEPVASTDLDDG